jgi:hypothetical protein
MSKNPVSRIGKGSIGGKALNLFAVFPILSEKFADRTQDQMPVTIPPMTVLATSCFDAFVSENSLRNLDFEGMSDKEIAKRFQEARLPSNVEEGLCALVQTAAKPLAVRSSGLFEDSLRKSCAGVYLTKMVPNRDPRPENRLSDLVRAVKLVLASAFFEKARRFLASLGADQGEEKIAVIIQEVVGSAHGERFYPTVSGTARSHDYYPIGHAAPKDGSVSLALGLGNTVTEGGRFYTCCPAYPNTPPPFNSVFAMMKETQTDFFAVNVGGSNCLHPICETEYLVQVGIDDAEKDGTLSEIASTYVAENDRLVPGTYRKGPRVLNFAPILQLGGLPLCSTLKALSFACEETLGTPVELEFAVDIEPGRPASLSLLQVRPIFSAAIDGVTLSWESLSFPEVIVASEKALGNGVFRDIRDIVFVSADALSPNHGPAAATELATINRSLKSACRPYVLIGYGRMGTSDPWRGVPAAWSQISGAKVIIEVQKKGRETEFSGGSHFFRDMTSSQTCYFSVASEGPHTIDWRYISDQERLSKGTHVTHVRSSKPLSVKVDGRSGRGIVAIDTASFN